MSRTAKNVSSARQSSSPRRTPVREWMKDVLREERYFRALIENSSEAIVVLDSEGTVRYESPSYERVLGYGPEERTDGAMFERLHPEDVPNVAAAFAEFLEKRDGTLRMEVRARHKDGSWRTLEAVGSNLLDDPIVKGIVVNMRDITDRKQIEEGLRREEKRFRALIDGSLDGIAILNADGTLAYESPSLEGITGYPLGERTGQDALGFVHPDDLPTAAQALADIIADPALTARLELRAQHKDGTCRYLEVTGKNLLDDPAVAGVVVNMRDSTERKLAEDALRRREDYFRALTENISEVMLVLDREGKPVYHSPSFSRMWGQGRGSGDLFSSVHPDDLAGATETFRHLLEHPAETLHTEFRGQHRDGTWRTFEVTAKNLLDNPAVNGIVVTFRDISEREEAEKALRESELQYSLLVDNIADAVFRYKDGVLVWGNDRIQEMMGYERDEVIGTDVNLLVPEDEDIAELMKRVMSDLQTKGYYRGGTRAKRKDGQVIDIEYTAARVPGSDPIELVGVARDVTERKAAEHELRRNFESLAAMNFLLGLPLADASLDELLEQGLEIILSIPWLGTERKGCVFLVEDDPDVLVMKAQHGLADPIREMCARVPLSRCICGQAARKGEVLFVERVDDRHEVTCPGIQPHGHYCVPIVLAGKAIGVLNLYVPGGHKGNEWEVRSLQAVSGVLAMIIERKRAGEELRRSEAKFKQIFNSVNDEIVLTDPRGVVVDVNDKAEVMLGYPPEEVKGHSVLELDIFDPDQLAEMAEMLQAAAAARSSLNPLLELWVKHKDGHLVPVEVSSSTVTSAEGDFEGFLGVIRDVSERKKAEEEREWLTAEIAEKNKELEHIVYVSSHDLRSPLVNIQGFSKELNYSLQEMVSILQHEEISQEVRDKLAPIVQTDIADSLTYIQASILKMDSLLSGLLRLSRLGRAALNIERLDVAGMVSEIIKGNEYRIKSAKVTVDVGDLPPCTGDSVQINQVFSNLVDNALKYLDPARPGTIRITGRTEGDRSVYSVEDNGIGIADEDREKVFEIFHQLNPGTSTGEGLGLAVVKKVLSRNDGRIWVESQPGVGSSFFVSLPGTRENESGGKKS